MPQSKTKRDIIREILDEIEPGWNIIKPSKDAPNSYDIKCVFDKGLMRVEVSIEHIYFQFDSELPRIKEIIKNKIKNAKQMNFQE